METSIERRVPSVPKLTQFYAKKLFGQFDNKIKINTSDRITAIIGPNGRGKTVCLRLIDAFYKGRYSFFQNIDFEYIEYKFDNDDLVIIKKTQKEPKLNDSSVMDGVLSISITYKPKGGSQKSWQPTHQVAPGVVGSITRYLPFLTRQSAATWSDDRTGERLNITDIAERYSGALPAGTFVYPDGGLPTGFHSLTGGIECHLIETQRLLILGSDESRWSYEARPARRVAEAKLVVEQKASKLRDLLQQQLADYSKVSEKLDRSFPRRVMDATAGVAMDREELTRRFQLLENERQALIKVGFLNVEVDTFVPDEAEETWFRVLSVYVNDTEEKLNVFSEMRKKIDLFIEIINDRFSGKNIDTNQKDGFVIKSLESKKTIPLDKLSSGEQHQLVLVFELLFELKENSIILIDEPELSLHVRWQKKFISDLKRIIALNHFDVILATHSPQLISHWRQMIVSLGSVHQE